MLNEELFASKTRRLYQNIRMTCMSSVLHAVQSRAFALLGHLKNPKITLAKLYF